MAASRVRKGYLLIADISGYTAFLTGNELEHAHGIIEDLTGAILAGLSAPVEVVKREGDAVFGYVPAEAFETSERVIELIESCYCRFADHKDDIDRSTTCQCTACRNISTLDLKFVAHFGEFIVQDTSGIRDLAGPDVILVHRLLKNSVVETTGYPAYAYLTDPVLERVGRPLAGPRHAEEYDNFAPVGGTVLDLREAAERIRGTRRVFISEAEADFSVTIRAPVPPAVAWEYWTNPRFSLQFFAGTTGWQTHEDERGRTGLGSSAHCAHGSGVSLTHFVDWRPFEYYSSEKSVVKKGLKAPPPMIDTNEFRPVAGGTEVVYRFRLVDRGFASRLRMKVMRPMLTRMFGKAETDLLALIERQTRAAAE